MENQQAPNLELPTPVSSPDGLNLESASAGAKPESASSQEASGNRVSNSALTQSAQPSPASQLVGATTQVASTNTSPTAATDNPAIADDVDLIEKEWVSKAKSIVDRTKNDPYVQNKELNVFKADYMKKRYGKDIKVVGE